jgi:hypothetical protein
MNNDEPKIIIPKERIENVIYFIRGDRVMLDRDLAVLFGVETRTLIQAMKRNLPRFPADFMFQLTKSELENWMSQIVISNPSLKMGLRKQPYAFTEQGVAMLSSLLRSPQAVAVNIEIMRTFIRLRQTLSSHTVITKELMDLKSFLLKHSNSNDREFKQVWDAIEKLTIPSADKPKELPRIGFNLNHD